MRGTLPLSLAVGLTLLSIFETVHGAIGEDGLCPLYVFAPFTNDGSTSASVALDVGNPGFAFMAAALLAMEHFNNRDDSVVPELGQLEDCNVRFDINNSLVFDTGTVTHMASRSLFDADMTPCAIAGPFSDRPALELSIMAQAARYPIVVQRSFNARVASGDHSPFSTSMFPDTFEFAKVLVSFLMSKGRTDFIGFLYPFSDGGIQKPEIVGSLLTELGVTWKSQSYEVNYGPVRRASQRTRQESAAAVLRALTRLKASGYRTFIVAMENPVVDFPLIADAAEELGINNGDYFWCWFGDFFPDHVDSDNNANITKLVGGSAWPIPTEPYFIMDNPLENAFFQQWRKLSQTPSFVDKVNAANPIPEGSPGYFNATPDFFLLLPEFGSGFMYDTVISIGLGGCLATRDSINNTATGYTHLQGIRTTSFKGVTGEIQFPEPGSTDVNSRVLSSTTWGIFNVIPPDARASDGLPYQLADIMRPGSPTLEVVAPFIYADGTTIPPPLLRDLPDQNYLTPGLRATGLSLMAFALFASLLSMVWIYVQRGHRIVAASQPTLLFLVCFGSMITASAIATISFDESYGTSEEQLDRLCMAFPWLMSIGHICTYGALFSKLWRVDRVLQFARRKIEVRQVAWPVAMLVGAALVVLVLWTALHPIRWVRTVVNEDTGESVGRCESDFMAPFIAPLVVLILVPTLLTEYMAYKTKDVDSSFAESSWIFVMILVQLEVIVIAVPVVIILNDISTDVHYLGSVSLIWTFPASALSLIILPKFVLLYRERLGIVASNIRGSGTGAVHITGMGNPGHSTTSATSNPKKNTSTASDSVKQMSAAFGMEDNPEPPENSEL